MDTEEQLVLTDEQQQVLIAVLNEVERIRNLSLAEKETILRGIFGKPFLDLTVDWWKRKQEKNMAAG